MREGYQCLNRQTYYEHSKLEWVEVYHEDYDISLRIDDIPGAAVIAFNPGHAYKDLPALRNLFVKGSVLFVDGWLDRLTDAL